MQGVLELGRRPIRWLREHPFSADSLLAAVLTIGALVAHLTVRETADEGPFRDPTWLTVLLTVATTLPVAWRRRTPAAVLLVVVAAQFTSEVLEVFGSGWTGIIVAVYSVGAHAGPPRRAWSLGAAGLAIVVLFALGLGLGEVSVVDTVATLGVLTASFVLGDNVRRRRLHVESLADRAERAERERDLLARERVGEERTRIARELHDIVAHSVSVMVIQASAARRNLATRPEAASALLTNIEQTGRQTMDELRHVLGVLREPDLDGIVAPLPTLADLGSLVESHVGLPVHLAVTGAVDSVPAGVGLAAYRVVQEALTNANRHAGPGASVDVQVTCDGGCVEVRVDDDGRGASAGGPGTPSGYGLLGMTERVAAAGGTFTAGPRPGGGWRVTARLPLQPSAAKLVS